MQKDIVAVGSIAFDSIKTPQDQRERILGGSLTHYCNAASLIKDMSIGIVGVVGQDFGKEEEDFFKKRNIDISDVQKKAGKTFFWQGYYQDDMNQAYTVKTELNVFADFKPSFSPQNKKTKILFLGNIHPLLQAYVLDNVEYEFCFMDTMNLWLETELENVKALFPKIHGLIINEGEAAILTGEKNYLLAGEKILAMGLPYLIIKRGNAGVSFFSREGDYFAFPAYPVKKLVDPTGAGDSFAGGFTSFLIKNIGEKDKKLLIKKALVYATALASFYVEGFGIEGLKNITYEDVLKRIEKYRDFSSLPQF